jgi:hypothetical protein
MLQTVDGYFYSRSDFTIFERILRLKPWHRSKAEVSRDRLDPTHECGGLRPALRSKQMFYFDISLSLSIDL